MRHLADNTNPSSLSSQLREKRFRLLARLLADAKREGPAKVLDLGGDPGYWQRITGFAELNIHVTLLNVVAYTVLDDERFTSVVGDAKELNALQDRSFDLVHSNSLLEHIGDFQVQSQLAADIRRVGKAYFVQTPNRHFPIEPHVLLPFFQYLPRSWRIMIAVNLQPGWYRDWPKEAVMKDASQLRLVTRSEFQQLFPDGKVYIERIWRLPKSFVAFRPDEGRRNQPQIKPP